MNTNAIKKLTLMHELSRLPDTRLDAVISYLESLLAEIPEPRSQNQSLKGIWKNAGFEKIENIEQELHAVRRELQDAIVKRTI